MYKGMMYLGESCLASDRLRGSSRGDKIDITPRRIYPRARETTQRRDTVISAASAWSTPRRGLVIARALFPLCPLLLLLRFSPRIISIISIRALASLDLSKINNARLVTLARARGEIRENS